MGGDAQAMALSDCSFAPAGFVGGNFDHTPQSGGVVRIELCLLGFIAFVFEIHNPSRADQAK